MKGVIRTVKDAKANFNIQINQTVLTLFAHFNHYFVVINQH